MSGSWQKAILWPSMCLALSYEAGQLDAIDRHRFKVLARWVREAGGHVDSRLTITRCAPQSGVRGLVCSDVISLDDVVRSPLVVVPDSLEMNGERARLSLEERLPDSARSLNGLDSLGLIVLWLAAEWQRKDSSFWRPYLETLPSKADCSWAKSEEERRASVVGLVSATAWLSEARLAAAYSNRVASGMESDYGEYLDINRASLEWALAMVSSRSMGGVSGAIVPVLDLVNHDHTASAFTSFDAAQFNAEVRLLGDSSEQLERLAHAVDGPDWALWSFEADNYTPRPLDGGDEVMANYICPDYDALDWWLHVGFIPPELDKNNIH